MRKTSPPNAISRACFASLTAQTRILLSRPLVATELPSGRKPTPKTGWPCPLNVACDSPVVLSKTFEVLSRLAVAIFLPSGDHATSITQSA